MDQQQRIDWLIKQRRAAQLSHDADDSKLAIIRAIDAELRQLGVDPTPTTTGDGQ